jgi:hypothetical protein
VSAADSRGDRRDDTRIIDSGGRNDSLGRSPIQFTSSTSGILTVTGAPPIVMIAVDYDPVVRGYVSSLARPFGRTTGISFQQVELSLKRLQLFKEAFPNLQAATVFWDRCPATNGKP